MNNFFKSHCFLIVINICLYGIAVETYSQNTPASTENSIEALMETLFPDTSAEVDYEEILEALAQLYTSPLDINKVTRNELAATYLFSHQQLDAFFDYKAKAGPFSSLYELQAIEGVDMSFIKRILPILTLTPPQQSFKKALQNPSNHYLLLRSRRYLQQEKGYSPVEEGSRSTTRYAGDPYHLFGRYRYSRANAYSFGLTFEKDPGEVLHWKPRQQIYGMDFTSFHAQIMNRGRLKNLVIGDFQLQAGQGLVFASGFSIGKGAEAIKSAYRFTTGIRPYTSVREEGFFRGIAATITLPFHVEITPFYARNRLDATLSSSKNDTTASISTGGLHRTPTERSKHNNLQEHHLGFYGSYRHPAQRLQVGFSLLATSYDISIQKIDRPYNQYEFRGTHNTLTSIHTDYRWRHVRFFSETARSSSDGWGTIVGSIIALNKQWDVALLTRYYGKNFHSFYGNPFREGSRPINEQGNYIGLKFNPNRRWLVNGYFDQFSFPWLRYLVDAPSRGHGYLLHAQWSPQKHFKIFSVLRSETKQTNNPTIESTPKVPLTKVTRTSAIMNVEKSWSRTLTTRTRLQGSSYILEDLSTSKGWAFAQDASLRFSQWELSGRIALFNTDDYDSRQYIYEKDVLYAFSLPAYYNEGTRHYLMFRYNVHKAVKLWIRWSQTTYKDIDVISSGLNEIQGNKRSELKAQLLFQL